MSNTNTNSTPATANNTNEKASRSALELAKDIALYPISTTTTRTVTAGVVGAVVGALIANRPLLGAAVGAAVGAGAYYGGEKGVRMYFRYSNGKELVATAARLLAGAHTLDEADDIMTEAQSKLRVLGYSAEKTNALLTEVIVANQKHIDMLRQIQADHDAAVAASAAE